MSQQDYDVVTVIGGGTMGLGIAQVAAMGGMQTRLFDVAEEQLFGLLVSLGGDQSVSEIEFEFQVARPHLQRIFEAGHRFTGFARRLVGGPQVRVRFR